MLAEDSQKQVNQYPSNPSNRAWIEEGILYNEYVGEVSFDRVMENEERSIAMINEQKIHVLPMIVIFKDIDKTGFRIGVKDYSKIISTFDLSKHISGAWIVGVSPEVKGLVDVVNKVFFANRMHFPPTLEEAQKTARSFLLSTKTILE